jgi:dTDP-L-rhamnose 4-epimerase
MRILITGGAGFIGSRLAKALSKDHQVSIFDNFHPQVHGYTAVREATGLVGICDIVEGGIENAAEVRNVVRSFDPEIIYHLAAETGTGQSYDEPTRYGLVNVIGTTNLLEAIREQGRGKKRVVLASSRAIYGEGAGRDPEGMVHQAMVRRVCDLETGDFALKDQSGSELTPVPMIEALPPAPASIYASTKLMQEYLCAQCLEGTDAEAVILRLQNVYGPGQSLHNPYTGVISIFSQLIARGDWLDIYEDGKIIRDFVYVDDVVDAFTRCAELTTVPAVPINIGSGKQISILDMARELLTLYGRDPAELRVTGRFRPGDVRHAVADITSAKAHLNWTPQVDFATGLKRFVTWTQMSADRSLNA